MPTAAHRFTAVALLVALLVWPFMTLADTEPPATEPQAATPPPTAAPAPSEAPQKTEVQGTPPANLVGRWLVVGQAKLPSGLVRPLPRLWEVREGPEHLEVVLHPVQLPETVNDRLLEANAASKPWTPSEQDLRELAEQWEKLTPLQTDYKQIDNKIMSADAYPTEFQNDEVTKGSRFAMVIIENFSGRQSVTRNSAVYGVREQTPTTLAGTFVLSTLAMAPFPIPITLKGDFQAYRLRPAPARSLLQRLFDLFAGCRRS